jgi:ribosomal peptide maturation radical SAM protein 1
MGESIIGLAPVIDYAFSGEADLEFPRFCDDFLSNGSLPASRIISCKPVDGMDELEIPDFDEYLQQLRFLQQEDLVPKDWPSHIPFESSRGCWWGERKRACFFCGLEPTKIKYRRKSRKRILDEIAHHRHKYGPVWMYAADNIMPADFKEVVDDLIDMNLDVRIFYEVRPTIEISLMDKFVKAGIMALQPGIESLSTNVLRKMGKGITALQNLKLLREARSRQIYVIWNFLVGVPGEIDQDYRPVLAVLPLIEHFQPPTGVWKIHLDRYSRYFCDPEKFGIRNVRPLVTNDKIYPANANLEELAYYFDADFESILSNNPNLYRQARVQCSEWIESWKSTRNVPSLCKIHTHAGWPIIKDTRKVAIQEFTVLDKEADDLLNILSEPTKALSIPQKFQPYLPELLDRKFVIFYEGHYISLVTDPSIGIRLRKERNPKVPKTRF